MAQSVLSDSYVGYSEELAIFEKPLQNVGTRRSNIVTYYPVNDFSNQGVIQFRVPNNGGSYLDLRSTRLNITCKIVGRNDEVIIPPQFFDNDNAPAADDSVQKPPGGDAASTGDASDPPGGSRERREVRGSADKKLTATVGVVNNFMHSLFSRVDVALQNKVLTHSDQAYPYLAYMKALLYSSEDMKNSTLQMSMFYKDTGSETGSSNWQTSNNLGLKTRSAYFINSKEVDMCGHLYSDILEISRFIPNGVPLNITLYPSTPEFCLLAPSLGGGEYKVVITKASLEVTMIDVAPVVSVSHAELLKIRPAIYPYIKTEVKRFTLARGIFSGELNDIFNSRIPSEMIIGLVSDSASHGTLTDNPFFFEHTSLNFIQVTVDGQDLSHTPIQPHYASEEGTTNSQYIEAYKTLSNIEGSLGAMPISREDYPNGNCFYRFYSEPTSNGSSDDIIPLKRSGNMRVLIKFDKPLEKPTTVVILAKFAAALKVDKNRAVYEV